MNRPMITAHSGCEDTGIDTMESIDMALELQADAIEIDVRVDPLGNLRVSHNALSLEDYLHKNLLEDVFRKVRQSPLLINFDLKEPEGLYMTLDAAEAAGFPTDRLIFTGCTTPEQLAQDKALCRRANFFLNLEEVFKYVYSFRKSEFSLDAFFTLMEDPWAIMAEDISIFPEIYLDETLRLPRKRAAISDSVRAKIYEDTVRTYQEMHAAAVNFPKILLGTRLLGDFEEAGIPMSVWTVNEAKLVRRCLEASVLNITTRKVRQAMEIRDSDPEAQE